ncbi:SAM dependent methyltransferase, putative [Plasmodium ovale wallikeri]|uniref:SAM dependent methyltransferase, putative n=1 Tax=Plasmodium ovale wallikeri TaxID=864142 RepID=A0A1A8ZUB4_PLAOA|nr:SAM dependent methyltransferase, putative [Plasmodium ovale wallikeri]SBT47503.1 SAM dependent methyltransferase, putative [Plasmodium ovale wallikeri]
MQCLRYYKIPICKNFKSIISNSIHKKKISDTCESKIIALSKSKEYDKVKVYRNNIYNNIHENQILQGVKVHKIDPNGYGEITIYAARQHLLFFAKFFLLIPDEEVNLKILDINKKKNKIIFQVLCKTKKSKHEIIPQCEYFAKCGGCVYQHINYDFEKQLKKNLLISLCEKYNINVLISNKDYLQNCHNFGKGGEQSDGEFVEISQIKSEYLWNEEETEQQWEKRDNQCMQPNHMNHSYEEFNTESGESGFQGEDNTRSDRACERDQPQCSYNQEENQNKDIDNVEEKRYTKLYDIISSYDYHYRNKSSINFSVTDHLSVGFYKKHSYEICDISKCYIHDENIQNVYVDIKKEIIQNFKQNNIYVINKINNNGYLKSVDIKYSVHNSEKQILINFIGYSLNDKAKKYLTIIANNLALKNKMIKEVISIDYSIDNIKILEENIKLNNIKNVKCFNLNLFNSHNLKQINLHIRRYIINLIKDNKYTHFTDLRKKLNSTYVSVDNENEIIENIQKIHSPYSSLPNFIYEKLSNCDSQRINTNTSFSVNHKADQNLLEEESTKLHSDDKSNENCLPNEFVIPIPDLVIINPPRKGCEKVFRRWLRGICCQYIIYISCNAYSQLRDINHFVTLGYVVKEIIPLDTFPRTQHFESIALLEFDINKLYIPPLRNTLISFF